MDAIEFLKEQISSAIPEKAKSVSDLAEKAGVNQPNLTEFMSGRRKSMNLETAWKLFSVLGLEVKSKSTARLPAPFNTDEALTVLPVRAIAGAGNAHELEESEALFHIAVPQQYLRPHISTLLVAGESMEPTILDRAVVGVNRESGEITQGKIYAVRLPYEGVVVKRLFLDHREKCFVLRSDNKGGDYPDIRLPFEEGDAFVYGRVVWVLQSYEKIAV